MSHSPAYVGIDVSFSQKKCLPIVIAQWVDGRLVPFELSQLPFKPPKGSGNVATLDDQIVQRYADDAVDYVVRACEYFKVRPVRIALDAPSMFTRPNEKRRAAERALDAAGISCFATPTQADFERIKSKVQAHLEQGGVINRIPHSNQLWMLVGFKLFETFRKLAPCIEVFPQAIAKLLGAASVYKTKSGGVMLQLTAVAKHTGWPKEAVLNDNALRAITCAPTHDALDAYMSAWVAALDESERVALGTPPDDVIWLPRIAQQAPIPLSALIQAVPPNKTAIKAAKSKQVQNASHQRLCPICQQHEFTRWPWGWDAHAAHKCQGLISKDPEERKIEYQQRLRNG